LENRQPPAHSTVNPQPSTQKQTNETFLREADCEAGFEAAGIEAFLPCFSAFSTQYKNPKKKELIELETA
jgi:hypothetical protein